MTVDVHWQVQQVKQRLSEVLRAAETDGPQFVTRHGKDVAVVLSLEDFHALRGQPRCDSLVSWVLSAPKLDMTDARIDELFERDRRLEDRETAFVGPDWE